MKILEMIKGKIVSWLSKKEDVNVPVIEQNTNQTTADLEAEIKKLNSRISFMTQKIEEMTQKQEQILCNVEQVLFHSSGSFATEEEPNKIETTIENGKNVVQMKGWYRLN